MTSSDILIKALAQFESCKLTAYRCPAGVWTIGFGHTQGVKQGQKITQAQAVALLKQDMKVYETYINKLAVCKTQGQFDALVDFAYNCGKANLYKSTLLKYIKQGESTAKIQAQFMQWTKARVNGKLTELTGLVKRRKWEANRWAEA